MNTNDIVKTNQDPIVVIGGTGQQGYAVVTALLERGVPVRALVRGPAAAPARQLARAGAELLTADLDNRDSLVNAFRGASAVFAMTTFAGPRGTDGEVEHGQAIGDAVRDAGIDHVVYSSVGGAERATGIPHFESKRRVEERLEALDTRVTFIRPTFFMDNFASFSRPVMDDGALLVRLPMPGQVPLQMVSVRDIGRAAAAALLDPDSVPGGAIEIAGDELTGEEIAAAFGQARGIPAQYEALPVDVLTNADQKKMFTWFAKLPAYQADKDLTRKLVPNVQDLRTWLKDHAR